MPRLLIAVAFLTVPAAASAQVLTSQYDNARTSATLTETTLTPANVNARQFGKLFSFKVDGDVYAQPLFVPRVEVPGKGVHDLVFVATEHDSVYAFDAAGHPAEPLWHVTFLSTRAGPVPFGDVRCPFIQPEVGITPTPVIDYASGTLYVLARTRETGDLFQSKYVHRLHALAITTGTEKFGGPVEIHAPGFDTLREMPRAGLLLSGGQVFMTWGSSCDIGPYHGWVMAYDAKTLAQTAVFNTSPGADQSGIWQSDMAPAADADGNVYVVTGNGKFTAAVGGSDYGDSALKLALEGRRLVVRSSFTPANETDLNARDLDLGGGGPMLPPGSRLLLVAGKDARLYMIDRDSMKMTKTITLGGGGYSTPASWNGHVYVLASNDVLKDFRVDSSALSDIPVAAGVQKFANPGAPPVISANGTRDGIVWLIETKVWNDWDSKRPSVLHAYEAANVSHELYSSAENAARDTAGVTVRFTLPTVANGRVYIGAKGQVDVYGLLAKP